MRKAGGLSTWKSLNCYLFQSWLIYLTLLFLFNRWVRCVGWCCFKANVRALLQHSSFEIHIFALAYVEVVCGYSCRERWSVSGLCTAGFPPACVRGHGETVTRHLYLDQSFILLQRTVCFMLLFPDQTKRSLLAGCRLSLSELPIGFTLHIRHVTVGQSVALSAASTTRQHVGCCMCSLAVRKELRDVFRAAAAD